MLLVWVVYFDQLSGTAHNLKLVKILFLLFLTILLRVQATGNKGSRQDQDNSLCSTKDLKNCWYKVLSFVKLVQTCGDVYDTKTYYPCWTVIVEEDPLNTLACSPEAFI